jgi:hypothetical protein
MQVSTTTLGTLFLLTTIVVSAVGVSFMRYRRKMVAEKVILESVGREICAEFCIQLSAIVPAILHRPTRVVSSVGVFGRRWGLLPSLFGVTITVTLSEKRDFRTIKSMLDQFVEEYLSRPGHRQYRVRTVFPPISSTTISRRDN